MPELIADNPLRVLALVLAIWVLVTSVDCFVTHRHLRKVDDLANALHVDLTKAEAELAKLRRVEPVTETLTLPKPTARTQPYGRHARIG